MESITFLLLLSSSLIFLVLLIKLAWNKDKNLGRMIGKLLQQLMTSFTLINKKYYGLGQVTVSVVVIPSTKEELRTNDSSTDGSTDDSSGLPNTNMEMMMGLGPSSDLNQQNFPPVTASEDRQWGQMSFSLDQPQFSTPEASNSNPDSSTAYDPEIQQQHTAYHNQPILMMNCPYPAELMPKYPHFHFTNNTPLWINASAPPATIANAQASFIPALQTQIPTAPFFDDNKPKVRKLAKLGDRITALHQLVSPFGKSDTASVLSEAIGYIKFLHGQVGALTDPCMKNGAPIQNQQKSDKSQDIEDGSCQDLRSRGLCLVPVSSTFPVIHETEAYFWTPTFG